MKVRTFVASTLVAIAAILTTERVVLMSLGLTAAATIGLGAYFTIARNPSPAIVRKPFVRLLSANYNLAVIETEAGRLNVVPGNVLPGIGIIRTIEQKNGRWEVVGSRGKITERDPAGGR